MKQKLKVRAARKTDASNIAGLIQGVAHYCVADRSVKGAEAFFFSISQTSIVSYITNPNFNYIIGSIDGELAGVAALKDNKHIYHLFVSSIFHRQGIATQLWHHLKNEAIAAGNPGIFTVNSSLYAVPVYSHFGFVPTAVKQSMNGIEFQPMKLTNS